MRMNKGARHSFQKMKLSKSCSGFERGCVSQQLIVQSERDS